MKCFIGDAVVVWRAWELGKLMQSEWLHYYLCAVPLILLIATAGAKSFFKQELDFYPTCYTVSGAGMVFACAGFEITSSWSNSSLKKWTVVWAVLTITTNFVVTLVIFCEDR
jgi:hypothetical protein